VTREGAIATGQSMATRFGCDVIVYRIRTWREGVYGCISASRELPREADTFERFAPGGAVAAAIAASTPEQIAPAHAQGSLF
jgi:hypothetical protein